MKLVIATFNIQNKYKLKKYAGIDSYGDHTKELVDFINDNNIDIIGVQELTSNYKKRLLKFINKKYKIVGKYRFTRFFNIFPYTKKYNETNSIITNKKIIKTKTYHLPFFPKTPRIATITYLLLENNLIRVINTHLENKVKKIRDKQLDYIVKLLEKDSVSTILMGDFNTTIKNNKFNIFIDKLETIGYKRIDMNNQTHRINKLPIDHIFIPKNWKVNNIESPNLKCKISDHKPIIVEVTI